MRSLLLSAVVGCAVLVSGSAKADTIVGVNYTHDWTGYMNVSELPSNGGAALWGSGWGTADLVAVFSGSTLTLSPNAIDDPNEYWYQNTNSAPDPANPGGPGALGNKTMAASMFIADDSLVGETIVFEGEVLANTFTSAHSTEIFIRDFSADYSSFTDTVVPASVGPFSISLVTDGTAGRHIQYGFVTTGENVWATDLAPFGSVVIGAVPEPSTLVVAAMALAGVVGFQRRS